MPEISPFHDMNTRDLLIAAGMKEEMAEQAQALITGLVDSRMLRSENPGDGLLWYLRSSMSALATLRAQMPFQPGDRVMLRQHCLEPEAARWAQRGLKAMTATFGEVGTVIRNDYNCVYGYWSVIVQFDHEWWEDTSKREIHEKEEGRLHVWGFPSSSLWKVEL